jgi:hypothetical protein
MESEKWMMKTFDFSLEEMNINEEEILLETSNYMLDSDLNGFIREKIHCLLAGMSSKNIKAQVACLILEGRVEQDILKLDETNLLIGCKIAKNRNKGENFALIAATAGEGFDAYQKYLSCSNDYDYLDKFILDAIGNLTVERAVNLCEKKINEEMKGMPHTHRFSPGYCEWPLSDQEKIMTILQYPCGIQMTDFYFLIPTKSISGIIGFGKEVKTKVSECDLCELGKTCYKSNSNKTKRQHKNYE